MLQHVAVCCIVVAVCCSVLQCVAVCCSVLQCVALWCILVHIVEVSHDERIQYLTTQREDRRVAEFDESSFL